MATKKVNNFEEDYVRNANLTLYQAKKIAAEHLDGIKASDATDLFSYNKLTSFMEELVSQDEICGDANDFHNFAVELARENQEQLACRLIERGLVQFPNNVDLLADYLQYGISIGKEQECDRIYKILLKIPRNRWTWRGFSFSINYLQHLIDDVSDSEERISELKKKIEEIADDYVKFLPYSEEGYRAKARVYASIKDNPDEEVSIVKQCMEIVKVCPKSALRSADIYFERGDYQEALTCVERAIRDANQTQGSINEGYVYYLEGLCKISLLNEESDIEIKKEKILEIYSAFNSAFLEFGYDVENTYKSVMVKKSKMLKSRFEVDIPFKYEKLLENIDE